ncbi:MAG: Jag N-terminal domain-containing protein [Chloroflexi bacterium]|nr:Jag N-terminal domain-containing protein [Chloroflexota bacterium]
MDQAEASGKTVEDALKQALAKLGARREEVELVVLDEGVKGGLFKRGRDAVVRVERLSQPTQPVTGRDVPDTRIPHAPQGRGQRGGPARGGAGERPPRGDRPQGAGRGSRDRDGGRGGRSSLEQAVPKLTEQDFLRPRAGDEAAPAGAAGQPRERREERAPRGDRADRPARPPHAEGERREGERRERRGREEEANVVPDINAEEVDFAAHIVDDLLRLLDINAELTIREPLTPGDGLGVVRAVIDISGDDLGLLIGRRGDTLLSFQYLVNLIVGRRFPGKGGVSVDVEHYRHRREEQVVALAQRMAERVRETGSPITLEPMSAAERRLVHLAISEDPALETNSIGDGDNRKVVISARR